MTARKLAYGFAALMLFAAGAAEASAQAQDAFCDMACTSDMQWFAPVDFDYECLPIRRDCGYFFNYNRASWHVSGERTPIGAPGLTVLSEDIFPEILQFDPLDDPPPQYLVQNGLQNVAPRGEFGWGNRYEAGYFSGQNGWLLGVIDDQTSNSGGEFGDGPTPSGFGSLHVNFELANPQLLDGFRDYNGTTVNGEEIPTPTIGGPGIGGNNVTDDLNGNLVPGFVFIFGDINGNGIFDDDEPIIGLAIDYGDLYTFNVTFNRIAVRNHTQTSGVEILKTHLLDNSHWFTKEQAGQIEIGAGVRFLKIEDEFGFVGTSDLLRGRTRNTPGNFVDTEVENQIVGPQIFARYTLQKKRLKYGVGGRFVFGYNIQDLEQVGVIGENLTPGDLNQPAILQPTGFSYGRQDNDFSPLAELRADVTYQVTGSLALKLGYTAIFVDNVTRAASVTKWRLPDMGFNPAGKQEILMNGADFGVELVY